MIDLLQLFLTHLQGYKRQAVWSPILIVVEVICELLLPLVMAEIVDTAIPAGDETYIFQLGAVMLVLAGVAMLCGVLAAKYSAFASQGFGANLRQCLFDKVQEFSFADIDRFSSASLITRMTNDVNGSADAGTGSSDAGGRPVYQLLSECQAGTGAGGGHSSDGAGDRHSDEGVHQAL